MRRVSQSAEPWVVGLGAGGHAKSVLDALLASREARPLAMLDADPARFGQEVLGVPVPGDDSRLPELIELGATHFFVGLGSVGPGSARRRLFDLGLDHGLQALSVQHPFAVVSTAARVGPGSVVLAAACVGPDAIVGPNAIVNTSAIVEHDCHVAAHAHIAIGARLAGGVRVGEGAHVGAGATVREGVTIGEDSVVAAGAVVLSDVPAGRVALGVPARLRDAA